MIMYMDLSPQEVVYEEIHAEGQQPACQYLQRHVAYVPHDRYVLGLHECVCGGVAKGQQAPADAAAEDDKASKPAPPKKMQTPEEYKALGSQLSSYFGTKVSLACNAQGKGKITIPFATPEELEKIMEILDTARQN